MRLGPQPDNLTNSDEEDVPFTLDFRDVYASLLDEWLHVDPSSVIARDKIQKMKLLRG